MTTNIQKEEISIAYASAVCAKSKASFDVSRRDEDGIDALIRKDGSIPSIIGVQLKSTTIKGVSGDFGKDNIETFTYPLKVKNYSDLIKPSTYPRILCLLILPEDHDEWLSQSAENLIIRKCMYYKELSGEPTSNNTETVSIEINKRDIFDAENLAQLFMKHSLKFTQNNSREGV